MRGEREEGERTNREIENVIEYKPNHSQTRMERRFFTDDLR